MGCTVFELHRKDSWDVLFAKISPYDNLRTDIFYGGGLSLGGTQASPLITNTN